MEEAQEEPPPASAGPIPADGLLPCPPIPEVSTTASLQEIGLYLRQARQPSFIDPVLYLPQDGGDVYRVGTYNDVMSTNFFAAAGNALSWAMLPQRLRLLVGAPKYFTTVPQIASELPAPLEKEGDMWVVEVPMRDDIQNLTAQAGGFSEVDPGRSLCLPMFKAISSCCPTYDSARNETKD